MVRFRVPPARPMAVYDSPDRGLSLSIAESSIVRKTALNSAHRQLGARMVDFNGWDMPVEYPANANRPCGGLISEHLAVRASVGLFDVSHMGDIRLHGPQALDAVQR